MRKQKEITFIEYRISEDANFDNIYSFVPKGNTDSHYLTEVTIDWLNEDLEGNGLIVSYSCNCESFNRRRGMCKHILKALEILKRDDFKFRLEENYTRFWCPVCHNSTEENKEESTCYKCLQPKINSDIKREVKSENN